MLIAVLVQCIICGWMLGFCRMVFLPGSGMGIFRFCGILIFSLCCSYVFFLLTDAYGFSVVDHSCAFEIYVLWNWFFLESAELVEVF